MSDARIISGQEHRAKAIGRDHPVVARVLRRWRELTGARLVRDPQRRTLVACSGGADSVALAAALACVSPRPVLGHVVHDLRTPELARADRDSVSALAERLGCDFLERSVEVRADAGNDEANARAARYDALRAMASESGCVYIATGHHADDQLETVLMHLMRGAGVRGMRGVRATRELGGGLTLVRPMIEITREEIERVCRDAGLGWCHDHTNDDHGYLRNRIRHTLVPMMREIEPEVALRAGGVAEACSLVSEMLGAQVSEKLLSVGELRDPVWAWPRGVLRDQAGVLVGELLRVYVDRVLGGKGADALRRRSIVACVDAIKSDTTDPAVHRVGPMVVRVTAQRVVIEPVGHQQEETRTENIDE